MKKLLEIKLRFFLVFRTFIFACFLCKTLLATHNRSGEILLKNMKDFVYQVNVVTYTNTSSPIERRELPVLFSDNTTINVRLERSTIISKDPAITKNSYLGTKTFKNIGTYKAYMTDPNRNQGILNLGGPSSVDMPFHIESEVIITPFIQTSSPDLKYPPIDEACLGQIWEHNPGASLAGDTFRYKLIPVKQGKDQNASVYYTPEGMLIDQTGTVTWNTPKKTGEYNIAIEIKQYTKEGRYKGFVVRDMQINVVQCILNSPELLLSQTDICKTIDGTALESEIKIIRQSAYTAELFATGLATEFPSPNYARVILDPSTRLKDTMIYKLTWNPILTQLIAEPYLIYLKAKYTTPSSAVFRNINIKLTAPPVQINNILLNNSTMAISLNWSSYTAKNLKNFKIFRKMGSVNFIPDLENCTIVSPLDKDYTEIAQVAGNNTVYSDTKIIPGQRYCYRVVALFEGEISSHMSNEMCINVEAEKFPIPLQASVLKTDISTGQVALKWLHPETVMGNPPYYYTIDREGVRIFTGILNKKQNWKDLDALFIDENLNTIDNVYNYQITLLDDTDHIVAKSVVFQTTFISLTPSNKKVKIQINDKETPWFNDLYYIYRQDSNLSTYILIDSTQQTTYIDKGLKNNINYGYYVITRGQYLALSTPALLNNSQEAFATPFNTVPPPPPTLSLNKTDCENFVNILDWQDGMGDEDEMEDIVKYLVYFSPTRNGEKKEIASVLNDNLASNSIKQFIHSTASLAGCYQLAAVNLSNKISILSNTICTDNCYTYNLPNIFTPNGDGKNDTFKALNNKFVEKINMNIYDRQGKTIFNSQDPNFIWDGRNYLTGQMLTDGIYLYVVEVYFITLDGVIKKNIRGDVTLISGK